MVHYTPINRTLPDSILQTPWDHEPCSDTMFVTIRTGALTAMSIPNHEGLGALLYQALPDEVLTCGSSASALDLSHKSIQHLSSIINSLISLSSTVEYGLAILEYFTYLSSIVDYLKEVSLVISYERRGYDAYYSQRRTTYFDCMSILRSCKTLKLLMCIDGVDMKPHIEIVKK
ncbi:hypothetical protein BC332_27789 [Capsicum chinense]|nr:hypothetical protein BC332_27789 [Capsicum chinense]